MNATAPNLVDRLLRKLHLARRGIVERELAALRKELTGKRSEVDHARTERDTAKRMARDLRARAQTTQGQLDTARIEIKARREELKRRDGEIATLRQTLTDTQATIEQARTERDKAVQTAHDGRARTQKAIDQLNAAKVEVRARREQIKTHRDEITARREDIKHLRDELRRTRATLGEPRDEMRAMLPVRAAAAPSRHPPDGPATEDAFASRSPAYVEASGSWRRGDRPAIIQRTIDGIHFAIPDDGCREGSLSFRVANGWLPLDDVVRVRPFAVGGVMLDIGGNIGTTCIPRVVFGDFARAYAAEPDLDNYQCLVGNALDNGLAGRVMPDRVAISSTNGTARLRRATRIGGHRLLAEGREWDGQIDEVPCLTVDAWLAKLGVAPESIGFVKVDTQGWDPHALAGAPGLLARREIVWQIEVSPPLMAQAGYSVADLAALVARHFTHVKEMDSTDGRGLRKSTDVIELVNAIEGRKRFTNLILLNAATPDV